MFVVVLSSLAHGPKSAKKAEFIHTVPPRVRGRDFTHRFEGRDHLGYVAWPLGVSGQRPGAIIAHQWTGVGEMERYRAVELAARGFVVFAPDLYGKGKRPAAGEAARTVMQATVVPCSKYIGSEWLQS